MRAEFLIPVIILVLILLVWYFREEDKISGVWVAPDDFAQSAETESMTVVFQKSDSYFFPDYSAIIHMPGYIGEFTLAAKFPRGSSTKKFSAKIKFEEEAIFPENVKIEYNAAEGRMVIHDDDTTYAVLFKNNELSYLAKLETSGHS